MSTAETSGEDPGDPSATFPKARHGYLPSAVDDFAAQMRSRLQRLRRETSALATENRRLNESLADVRARFERLQSAELDERARDILTAAEQQAQAIIADHQRAAERVVTAAQGEADVIAERARQELAWGRRRLRQERADLSEQQLVLRHHLSSFKALAKDTTQRFPDLAELSYSDVSEAPPASAAAVGDAPGQEHHG